MPARNPSPLVISEFRVGHLNLRRAQLWIHFNVLIKLFRVIINDMCKKTGVTRLKYQLYLVCALLNSIIDLY